MRPYRSSPSVGRSSSSSSARPDDVQSAGTRRPLQSRACNSRGERSESSVRTWSPSRMERCAVSPTSFTSPAAAAVRGPEAGSVPSGRPARRASTRGGTRAYPGRDRQSRGRRAPSAFAIPGSSRGREARRPVARRGRRSRRPRPRPTRAGHRAPYRWLRYLQPWLPIMHGRPEEGSVPALFGDPPVVNSVDSPTALGQSPHSRAATLEFREATKIYPGTAGVAVDGLSLEVPAGEICVLVGPSGCGKTTAMRMVNRMIDITRGDILLDGDSVKERQPSELRREIGYAIQQIGLFPHMTVADNIGTVPRLLGWDKARIRSRVHELLELVSLDPDETLDRYPAELSGGQRQRVGVARALAVDPPLMLMDEPFGAIDPINRERLQNEFLRLQREMRKTIVFVTH